MSNRLTTFWPRVAGRATHWLTRALGCWLAAQPVLAVSPSVTSLNPPGGMAGTEVEVQLNGSRLEDAQELLLYSPGLTVRALEAKGGTKVRALIAIEPSCTLGEHQLRLRTLSGLSEIRTFFVGPFQTIKESEPNNEPAKAQMVPLNSTLSGTITSEDSDYFKFPAKKGQRLSVELEAIQLGRVLFDAYLSILAPDGKALATCDDSMLRLQDPVLSLLIPADGFYSVLIRDSSWGGAEDFVYRLHLGSFPRPMLVYPLGAAPGESAEFTFLGDPIGPWKQRLSLPTSPLGETSLFAEQEGLRSPSGNRIRLANLTNVFEVGDNHQRASANPSPVSPPFALNGILAKAGEQDWFSFLANKQQPLELSVYGRRLRSPIDSVLQIYDAKGKLLDSNDDGAGPDSVLKFTPEETGRYFLRINDQLGSGGADYAYRVEVRLPEPRAELSIPEVARNDTQTRQSIAVPRGNRMATLLRAKRSAFNGELSFEVPDLPAGVSVQAESMPSGVDIMPWVFTASPDAGLAGRLIRPVARPTKPVPRFQSSFRHSLELVRGNNDQVYYGTFNDQLAVAVIQEVPFQLTLEPPSIALVRAGNLKLKVGAVRRPGFDDPITIKMLWNPPGVTAETEVTIGKGKTSVDYPLTAKGDAPVSTWKIVVLGSAPHKGGTAYASSDLTPLRVSEPFILGKITTVVTEPGRTFQMKCDLDQREPFAGKALVRLVGLPDKAQTQDREITQEDKEVVFDVTLDPKIPTGSHKNLACQVHIKEGDETIVQTVGSGGILRIVQPKKTVSGLKRTSSAEAIPPAK
ncbi:MAG: PPC domain-containing protein [Verrucomicrobiales bacterium]|nr:PPC domain-containing protein [Verrucomicrobiales bacterium]